MDTDNTYGTKKKQQIRIIQKKKHLNINNGHGKTKRIWITNMEKTKTFRY